MVLDKILKLGDPQLYEKSIEVQSYELPELGEDIQTLFTLIAAFRRKYGSGRGIAAPQIGIHKRIICLDVDGKRDAIINPVLSELSEEKMEIWDDCMCFPKLLVKVMRHKSCTLTFRDMSWKSHTWRLTGDLCELVQHEYDHLEGILATQRAVDTQSFRLL